MNKQTLQLIIIIVDLILKYGTSAVSNIISALEKDEITLEDIQKLRELVKPPESY
jgi:hypothetical protein